ncbi:MAG: hypothetical protein IT574_01050 [Candidatus Aureabacteria bacterium]|jgi:methylphosphotriester-DNA--protein-cysteine methyltransferase|nr:hypothetical protein [Candidatus Auribacterota bacterium]NLW93193.1 hypothetical protein [Chlamydiota bacterium]HOE26776.1 Ada metal-binding domain-containing protein [bacterium]HQM52227.1 Ada metal-binding domain-containing protein [bacterium]
MRRSVALRAAVFLAYAACVRAQEDPSAAFEDAKALMVGALQARIAAERSTLEARQKYEQARTTLKGIKLLHPDWNPADVSEAAKECEKALSALTGSPARDRQTAKAAEEKPKAAAQYVGHKKTKKYHRLDCRYAVKLSEESRVPLASVEEAEAGGFVGCKTCKPDADELAALRAATVSRTGGEKRSTGPFFGIPASMKAHRADCRWTKDTAEKNKVYFQTYAEAGTLGYAPCKLCRPNETSGAVQAPGERMTAPVTASAPPAAAPAPQKRTDGNYCAGDRGKTFHRSDCPWAKGIDPASLVTYKTREEAIAARKKPCRICNP